jgi:hypothetical protein
MMNEEQRIQLISQCNAIVHMATQIARVHADIAQLNANGVLSPKISGTFTAARMEILGNMLNNMDAVIEDDDWLTPIFEKSQTMWTLP